MLRDRKHFFRLTHKQLDVLLHKRVQEVGPEEWEIPRLCGGWRRWKQRCCLNSIDPEIVFERRSWLLWAVVSLSLALMDTQVHFLGLMRPIMADFHVLAISIFVRRIC